VSPDPTLLNLSPSLTVLVDIISTVLVGLVPTLVTFAVAKFRLNVTADQKASLQGAALTAVGMVTLAMRQGIVKIGDVHIANDRVRLAAQYVIDRAPTAAAKMGWTVDTVAHTIVGKVGNALDADPATPSPLSAALALAAQPAPVAAADPSPAPAPVPADKAPAPATSAPTTAPVPVAAVGDAPAPVTNVVA
jgi:hypothetical protein